MTTATMNHISTDDAGSVANLLRRIGDGDPAAWDEIIRRYGRLVSATVRSFRLQEADAFDAIQMTWMRLVENAHQVRTPERLGGWLATTARRECLRILHQTKHGPNLVDMATEVIADPSASPERRAVDADTSCVLWKLVDELSPRRRTVLRTLFTDDTCSYDQVARIVGIPLGAIGPTRARALGQLRKMLSEREVGLGT
ncbi:MAG: RNA polymerase sigma factor [Pseudonocardiaceae bacterium]